MRHHILKYDRRNYKTKLFYLHPSVGSEEGTMVGNDGTEDGLPLGSEIGLVDGKTDGTMVGGSDAKLQNVAIGSSISVLMTVRRKREIAHESGK